MEETVKHLLRSLESESKDSNGAIRMVVVMDDDG